MLTALYSVMFLAACFRTCSVRSASVPTGIVKGASVGLGSTAFTASPESLSWNQTFID
jgi:hypothetical protein